tara:strand:+ start:2970 stop:3374 length:405 start_codon:yes stop_codon:yes gene_type:complete
MCRSRRQHALVRSATLPRGGLISIGFADHVPDYATVKSGTANMNNLDANAPALVIYGYAFGTAKGDVLMMFVDGPEGRVAAQAAVLDKPQALAFRAVGKKRREPKWPAGSYAGSVTLLRGSKIIDRMDGTIVLR